MNQIKIKEKFSWSFSQHLFDLNKVLYLVNSEGTFYAFELCELYRECQFLLFEYGQGEKKALPSCLRGERHCLEWAQYME